MAFSSFRRRTVIQFGAVCCTAGALLFASGFGASASPAPGTQIQRIAGGGSTVPSLTPTNPADIQFNSPYAVHADAAGNLYIDNSNNGAAQTIDKIDATTGLLSVVVGGGQNAPTTTPQPATDVYLSYPYDFATAADGTLYIADTFLQVIEKVTPNGLLSIIAGGGGSQPSTTPQLATSVVLDSVEGVAVAASGAVYIGDTGNNLIEFVDPSTGMLSIFAGGGATTPTTSPISALSAALNQPTRIAVSPDGSTLMFNDAGHNRVDKIDSAGNLSVFIGGGGSAPGFGVPMPATNLTWQSGWGVAFGPDGELYAAQAGTGFIIKVDPDGSAVAIAGGGSTPTSYTLGDAQDTLIQPNGLSVDSEGNLYIGDNTDYPYGYVLKMPGVSTPPTTNPTTTAATTTTAAGGLAATGTSTALSLGGGLVLLILGGGLVLNSRRRQTN